MRPRVSVGPRWIRLNREAHQLLGQPDRVTMLFDAEQKVIGIRAARPGDRHTLSSRSRSSYGSRLISSQLFLATYQIKLTATLRFTPTALDREKILCLHLSEGVPVSTGYGRPSTNKQSDPEPLVTVGSLAVINEER